MNFWLATTDHFSDRVLFKKKSDFVIAMNYVAVLKHITGANILAFIIMSNHLHFVFECTKNEAIDYMNRLKTLYGRYFAKEYGVKDILRLNNVHLEPLFLEDESLHRAIAYVLMNSVSARLCLYMNDYPWGSGRVYFNAVQPGGVRIGTLSKRARQRILKTWAELNSEWILLNDGYISPSCYISYKFVESLFRTPARLKFFLDSSSKAIPKQNAWPNSPGFSDQTIVSAANDYRRTVFQKREKDSLTPEQTEELARQLRRRFSLDIAQLCRILNLSYEEAAGIFDKF